MYKNKKSSHNIGFTLVELMVVIAITVILTGIILMATNGAKSKSRDAKRVADIGNLALSLELYFNKNHKYPSTLITLASEGYIQKIPSDPSTNAMYFYAPLRVSVSANCNYYHLGALLENANSASLNDDHDKSLLQSVAGATVTNCSIDTSDFDGRDTNANPVYDLVP